MFKFINDKLNGCLFVFHVLGIVMAAVCTYTKEWYAVVFLSLITITLSGPTIMRHTILGYLSGILNKEK